MHQETGAGMAPQRETDFDYVIIGSGFGGSVAALRLSEKGYRVLVVEKGRWFREADFPRSNWNLKRWLWLPALRFFGFFKLTLFRYQTVLSGVAVGGGSIVYSNVLQIPSNRFFEAQAWAHLADWKSELEPHYQTALTMLGAAPNPRLEVGDRALQAVAADIGMADRFGPTQVSVYFGEPDVTIPDPYFEGRGPERTGCNFCGGCMTGCRYGAKNTLDRNYLHLAMQEGAVIRSESEVYDVRPLGAPDGSDGYEVLWKSSTSWRMKRDRVTAGGVVFAGGTLGSVKLLLDLKEGSLPNLSGMVGRSVRTNSESLIGVTTFDRRIAFSDGVSIGSILHTDEVSHLEPVRYASGSGFWRLQMSPLVHGRTALARMARAVWDLFRHPIANLRVFLVWDWSKRTQILLFMRTTESRFRFTRGRFGMRSSLDSGQPPTAFIPEAKELAERFASKVNGKPMVLLSESVLGIPTTAHILGGAVMGRDAGEGVIDRENRVFGYHNMYVCDGSVITANPGVNPSLSIVAIIERAMSAIPGHQYTRP